MVARIVLILAGFLFFAPDIACIAQNNKAKRSGSMYSMDKRRDRKKINCPVFENSRYPYHGIGLKLGDPFAITYKYYMSERFGIAVDFGKTASRLCTRYYRGKVYEYIDVDTASEGASLDFLSPRANQDWGAELKFLSHIASRRI